MKLSISKNVPTPVSLPRNIIKWKAKILYPYTNIQTLITWSMVYGVLLLTEYKAWGAQKQDWI
jgi:hypothetical protein